MVVEYHTVVPVLGRVPFFEMSMYCILFWSHDLQVSIDDDDDVHEALPPLLESMSVPFDTSNDRDLMYNEKLEEDFRVDVTDDDIIYDEKLEEDFRVGVTDDKCDHEDIVSSHSGSDEEEDNSISSMSLDEVNDQDDKKGEICSVSDSSGLHGERSVDTSIPVCLQTPVKDERSEYSQDTEERSLDKFSTPMQDAASAGDDDGNVDSTNVDVITNEGHLQDWVSQILDDVD
jgi:hypothetical protein